MEEILLALKTIETLQRFVELRSKELTPEELQKITERKDKVWSKWEEIVRQANDE